MAHSARPINLIPKSTNLPLGLVRRWEALYRLTRPILTVLKVENKIQT